MSRRPLAHNSIQYDVKVVLAYIYSLPLSYMEKCDFLNDVRVKYSRTGMPRYVLSKEGERLFTIRAHDGVPTLSLRAALLLNECLPFPHVRVIVDNKKIIYADFVLPKGVDAIIINMYGKLIGVGRTRASGHLLIGLRITDALTIREVVE